MDVTDGVRFRLTGYGHFDARRRVGPAHWAWFDLLWVHGGRVSLQIADGPAVTLRQGEGVLIYPHTPFFGEAITRVARASVQHFELLGRRARSLPLPLRELRGQRGGYRRYTPTDAETYDEMIDRMVRWSLHPPDPLIHDLRVAQLALILGRLELAGRQSPEPGPRQDELGRLLDAMRRHPERAWTLDQMAAAVGLSVSHFRAMFRDRVGVSPGRYHQQLRLREAARLLRDTGEPIKRIALRLGFADLPHFHRQFKAEHGQTPRRYRDAETPRA